jgi:superfamily II DNA helicase RecQ
MRTVEKMRYYAQESGRAGRNREMSEAIVMQPSVPSDRSIRVRRPCLSKLIDGKSA